MLRGDRDDLGSAPRTAPVKKLTSWQAWAVYGAGLTLLTALDVLTSTASWHWAYFVGVGIMATVVLRHRIRAWLLATTSMTATAGFLVLDATAGIIGSFGLGECFGLLLVTVTTVRRASTLRTWVEAVSVIVALLAVPLRVFSSDTATFEILLVGVTGCAVAAGTVLKNMDGERRLALAVAMQEQRDSLARDLHDDFTNRVTSMVLMVQALRRSPEAIPLDDDLARVERAGAEALGAMRRWVATLRSDGVEEDHELSETPLAQMRLLLDQWEAMTPGGRARLTDRTRANVPVEVQSIIYRIVQEAVTNVARHAPHARWLDVSVIDAGTTRVLEVVNPSGERAGMDLLPGSTGLGIISMRERARLHDGDVEVGPGGSSTWVVRATFPLGVDS
jgi:signal transduction histidine kinase